MKKEKVSNQAGQGTNLYHHNDDDKPYASLSLSTPAFTRAVPYLLCVAKGVRLKVVVLRLVDDVYASATGRLALRFWRGLVRVLGLTTMRIGQRGYSLFCGGGCGML